MSLELWKGIAIGSFIPWLVLATMIRRKRASKRAAAKAILECSARAKAVAEEWQQHVRAFAASRQLIDERLQDIKSTKKGESPQ